MNYYFVDYENVHSEGFSHVECLKKDDVICIMYTDQSKNFTLDVFEKVNRLGVTIEAYKAGTGSKNALDFQLSSYLGYIIAKNAKDKVKFHIISKDTGYDVLIRFWQEKGISVDRMIDFSGKQAEAAPKKATKKKAAKKTSKDTTTDSKAAEKTETKVKEQTAEKAPDTAARKNSSKTPEKKSKDILAATKEEMLQCITQEEYSDRILEIFNSYKTKQAINNALAKEFKDTKKSSAIYKKLKPLIKDKKKS